MALFGFPPESLLDTVDLASEKKLKEFGKKCIVRSGSDIEGVQILLLYIEKTYRIKKYNRKLQIPYVFMYSIDVYSPINVEFSYDLRITRFGEWKLPWPFIPYVETGGTGGFFSSRIRLWKGQDLSPPNMNRFALVRGIITGHR